MDIDARFQSVLQRAKASAERRAEEAELARRRALPPLELRAEAFATWEPLREAVCNATDKWNAELTKFGYRISALVDDRDTTGTILEILRIQTTRPDGGLNHPLQLSPVVADPGHISYAGPKGNVINGNQGMLPLFKTTADQLLDLVLRHVEEQVR